MTKRGRAVLQLTGISKSFSWLKAVDNVDLSLAPGEIHTVLGKNGAGKSTLMNLISGLYRPEAGSISVSAQPVTFHSPRYLGELSGNMLYRRGRRTLATLC